MKTDLNTKHGCDDAQCPDYAGYVKIGGTMVSLGTDQIDPEDLLYKEIKIDPDGKGWSKKHPTNTRE